MHAYLNSTFSVVLLAAQVLSYMYSTGIYMYFY